MTLRFSKSICRSPTSIGSSNCASACGERGAPQHGLHPARELADRERLGDVVVGAELEAEDLVGLLGLRGEHDDRHRAARADRAAHVEAVHPRQHHVEHDEVEVVLAQPVERLAPVERGDDVVALLAQRVGQKLLDGQLVVHEQDAWGSGAQPQGIVGCADFVIEPRIYRAAFVPALLAVVLTMFSFESRPGPLRQGLPADVLFDGNQAAVLAAPDRGAGARQAGRLGGRPRDRPARGRHVRGARLRGRRRDAPGRPAVHDRRAGGS